MDPFDWFGRQPDAPKNPFLIDPGPMPNGSGDPGILMSPPVGSVLPGGGDPGILIDPSKPRRDPPPSPAPRFGKPIGPENPTYASPPPTAPQDSSYLDFVRKQEGFNPKAYGDYKQTSIGYGTRARPGETSITREEGERRLGEELDNARRLVRGFGVKLSPLQEDALTDLTYNAGGSWMTSGLGAAVKAGDWQRAADIYRQYNKAGGQTLPGLVNRRNAAAPWLLDTGGGSPQITAQGALPTSQPSSPGQPRGRGMIDFIKGIFGSPAAAADQSAPVTAESIIANLDRLGIAKDDPMRGTYEYMAHSLAGGRKPQPEMAGWQKGLGVFADTLGAGLGRRGGNSAAQPIFMDMLKQQDADRAKLEDRQYQAPLQLLQATLPYRMKEIERQRKEALLRQAMGLPPAQPPKVAPGGAQGVQIGQGTAAPVTPVQRQALPPLGAGLPPEELGPSMQPPAGAPGMPQGGPTPSPAPTPAAQPVPASGAPQAAPQQADENRPLKYRGTADQQLLAEMDRRHPLIPDERINAMMLVDPARAKIWQEQNADKIKLRAEFMKAHEQQRADDPDLAGRKAYEVEIAKKKAELEHARTIAQQGGKSMLAGVDRLKAVPGWAGKSFEKTIGPFDNFDGPGGYLPVGPFIGAALTAKNQVGSGEVRDTIKADIRAMMMKAKEMVRGPGEGAWTDADQRNLDEISGDLLGSRDSNEYGRKVPDIGERVYRMYLEPKGIKREDIGLGPAVDRLTGKPAPQPGATPGGAPQQQAAPQLAPEQVSEIKRRYETGDASMKAAIEKQLRETGIDPTTIIAKPQQSGSTLGAAGLAADLMNPAGAIGRTAGQAIYNYAWGR